MEDRRTFDATRKMEERCARYETGRSGILMLPSEAVFLARRSGAVFLAPKVPAVRVEAIFLVVHSTTVSAGRKPKMREIVL